VTSSRTSSSVACHSSWWAGPGCQVLLRWRHDPGGLTTCGNVRDTHVICTPPATVIRSGIAGPRQGRLMDLRLRIAGNLGGPIQVASSAPRPTGGITHLYESRQGLQNVAVGVEEVHMGTCHQCGGYGHRPQPPVPRTPQPPLVSTRTLMCARCGDPLDGHQMFSECFPHGYLIESSVLLHRGRLVAV
jgi:hypothetical protein